MPLPNLIHPITVTIQKSNKSASVFDTDAREPIRVVGRETVTISAQVSMRRTSDTEPSTCISRRLKTSDTIPDRTAHLSSRYTLKIDGLRLIRLR